MCLWGQGFQIVLYNAQKAFLLPAWNEMKMAGLAKPYELLI